MITLDDLYHEMKDAMQYLGVRWGDKHLVKAFIENEQLVLSYHGRQIHLDVNNIKRAA